MTTTATKWHWIAPSLNMLFAVTDDTSTFEALINGNPTTTTVPYDTDFHELGLPVEDYTDESFGRMLLNNVTRGNTRKIEYCDPDTNIIYTEASTDNWVNNDIIKLMDPTINSVGFLAVDISEEIPADATGIYYVLSINDPNLMTAYIHPISAYADSKATAILQQVATREMIFGGIVQCTNQKIGIKWIAGAGAEMQMRIKAYTTEVDVIPPTTSRVVSPKGVRIA